MKIFNDLADFSSEEINALLKLSRRLERKPEPRALEGKILSLLFLGFIPKTSGRSLVLFERF